MLADCEQGALFKVTDVNTTTDTTTLLRATSGGGETFENAENVELPTGDVVPATLSFNGRSYGVDATVGVFESNFFFVAESEQPDNRGDPVQALWVKQGTDAPLELVRGVEDMQVLYGIGTQYLTIDQVTALAEQEDIVSMQVRLRISSVDPITELGNQPMRRTFTKTIFIRNANLTGRLNEIAQAEEEAAGDP